MTITCRVLSCDKPAAYRFTHFQIEVSNPYFCAVHGPKRAREYEFITLFPLNVGIEEEEWA